MLHTIGRMGRQFDAIQVRPVATAQILHHQMRPVFDIQDRMAAADAHPIPGKGRQIDIGQVATLRIAPPHDDRRPGRNQDRRIAPRHLETQQRSRRNRQGAILYSPRECLRHLCAVELTGTGSGERRYTQFTAAILADERAARVGILANRTLN